MRPFDQATGFSRTGSSALPIDDTVRMPWTSAAEFEERIVRPTLAILYRIAIGPGADYYCPRFLRYERAGRALPGWHWSAFLFPAVWAFYRKLWLPGVLFALLPFVGVAALDTIAPWLGDSEPVFFAAVALTTWLIPGAFAAVLANALVYARIQRMVRSAETRSDRKYEVATELAQRKPISLAGALAAGGGALALFIATATPNISALHDDSLVRSALKETIAAMEPLQQEIEAIWQASGEFPARIDYAPALDYLGVAVLDTVNLSPVNGRLRLLLGPALREIAGRVILLAPTVDGAQHIHWTCVPVDVPTKYLPPECVGR